ncbi:immunoglobulin domain-containing protein, partial [Taibaiella lutea]|uniref:immunoglobulin domain-containing protein n=1 Tax=Taibaiella lutea TaxID=2608001 RepID=UPI001C0F6623
MRILILLTSVGWLLGQSKSFAQTASQYGFTAVAGTYATITGTSFTPVQGDDNCSTTTIPLNFTFNFCGVNYTSVRAGSNGYLTFSTGSASTAFNDASSFGTIKPALMWLWDDLDGATGQAVYTTTGAAPNRVFTFQFKNWEWNWSTTGPNISCQVKLYETTNVIEYIYNQESQPGNPSGSSGASIGIVDGLATPTYLSLNNATPTPTASSTTFTTGIATKPATGQIYRWTPPANCSAQTGLPTAATTTVTPGNVCYSQAATLEFVPNTPMPPTLGLTYQWQSAPAAGGPWTNLATTTGPTYSVSPVASPYYRCQLICNGTTTLITTPASAQVVVLNPGTPATTPGSRCGPGTVNLTATPAGGAGIRWFTSLTQTIPISTNNTYSTPYLTQNTTYYAASVVNGNNAQYNVGLPNFIQNNPFITTSVGWGLNFTVTNTCNIDSVGVYPIGTGTIQMRVWNATTQAVVYTGPVSPSMTGTGTTKTMVYVGANSLPPGNYIMGIAAFTGLTNLRNEGFNASAYPFTCPVLNITSGSQGFNSPTANVYYFSYDWRVSAIGGCEGPRVPVVATINSSPVVGKTFPAVVCNNKVAAITLTQPTPAYPSYNWTPITNLYTNAAATTPYTGGSATSIYMKTTNVGQQTYYLMAGDPTIPTGCTFADTINIWVQPDSVTIKGLPDSICVTGTSTLSLMPATGYAPNSVQWQESTTGVPSSYVNITGATGTSYTTPTLTANHYYRALVKSITDTCQMPVKYVVVVNPQLLGVTDSFNCGPGTVTLQAQTGGNSTAKWYDVPTGGLSIGSGTPWITPSLTASQTYYVAAEGGSGGGAPVTIQVGTGTTSSGGTGNLAGPYSEWWRRYSLEFLYTAPEIIAAGGNPGNLTSLAFNCTSLPANPIPNFTIKVKFVPSTMTTLTTWQSGTTQVYTNSSVMPVIGWNTYTFTGTPLVWNGTDNIVIEVCRSQVQPGFSSTGNHQSRTISGRFLSNNTDDPGSSCGIAGTGTNTNLPNARFGMQAPCETPRLAVHANIYPKPVVDLGPDVNMCVDGGTSIVLDAGVQPNTPSFLWDNLTTSQVRAVNT